MSVHPDLFEVPGNEELDVYWTKRPEWCRSDQTRENAETLVGVSKAAKAANMLEIGSSAGEGAAALLHGSAEHGSKLYGIDKAELVYYDNTKKIGAVVEEAFPEYSDRYFVYAGETSKLVQTLGVTFDLVHIDAHHSHPWALLDLLQTLPALNDGAYVVLDDALYAAPLSQAAHFIGEVFGDLGYYHGGHYVFRYRGVTEELVRLIVEVAKIGWQTNPGEDFAAGLYEWLSKCCNPAQAHEIVGTLMLEAAAYIKHEKTFLELNRALWKRELERRKLLNDGDLYTKHK